MTKMRVFLLLGAVLGFSTCQKEVIPPPPGPSDDPVFSVNYLVNGTVYNQVAGKLGVYLFTNYAQDQNEVKECIGSFAADTCRTADCPGTIRFIWRNNALGNDFTTSWRTGLFPMYYDSHSDSLVYGTYMQFVPGSSAAPEPVWTLNDSIEYITKEVYMVGPAGLLHTNVTATHQAGYESGLDQQFLPAANRFCVDARLEAQVDTPTVLLRVLPTTSGSFEYHWYNDSSSPEVQATWASDVTYAVTVTDIAAGCSAVLSLGKLPPGTGNIQAGSIAVESKGGKAVQVGGPVIEWIDEAGDVWRSDRQPQSYNQGRFRILEIVDYLSNENGQPTKQMRVNWSCMLFKASGESTFITGSGIIAVAWPG